MRIYCIAQRTLLKALFWLNEKGVQKGGDICICMADSFCCTVETNTTWWSNYTPIKIDWKKKNDGVSAPVQLGRGWQSTLLSMYQTQGWKESENELMIEFELESTCLDFMLMSFMFQSLRLCPSLPTAPNTHIIITGNNCSYHSMNAYLICTWFSAYIVLLNPEEYLYTMR